MLPLRFLRIAQRQPRCRDGEAPAELAARKIRPQRYRCKAQQELRPPDTEPGAVQLIWRGVAVLLIVAVAGCAQEKESLHDDDHELPAHWPSSMADAADKIEQRLGIVSKPATDAGPARAELKDLVEWAPEIAADTDLPEADWNPIYETSETIRRHMAAEDISVSAFQEDIERLSGQLRQAHQQVIRVQPLSADSAKE